MVWDWIVSFSGISMSKSSVSNYVLSILIRQKKKDASCFVLFTDFIQAFRALAKHVVLKENGSRRSQKNEARVFLFVLKYVTCLAAMTMRCYWHLMINIPVQPTVDQVNSFPVSIYGTGRWSRT